ncbi:MAG TPA: CmcI family methyltransferase [Paludibaculum sp.]|jgi:cephalosporin hydroxylase
MRNGILWLALGCVVACACSGCHRKKDPPRPAAQSKGARDTGAKLTASEVVISDQALAPLLLRGFYEPEGDWRWTARKFAVALTPLPGAEDSYLVLDFALPVEVMQKVNTVTLTARVNGTQVGSKTYKAAGRYSFYTKVPQSALSVLPAVVEFELDKSVSPDKGRELGLIAVAVSLTHTSEAPFDREAETVRARQGYQYLLAKRDLLMPPAKQHEMMKLFHDVPVWRHMFFHNVQMEKNPLDLWMMQQIIYETQPEYIVETGTWKGGSALYWAHTLNGMELSSSRVITVDVQNVTTTAAAHPLWKKYVTFLQGSSTDPKIVARIAELVKGHKTLVVLDSDHRMAHVVKELQAYAPLVSKGSYLVVEDTHLDGVPTDPGFGPGPLAAVRQFLDSGGSKEFDQDLAREAYIMTFNPGGWLRRKGE